MMNSIDSSACRIQTPRSHFLSHSPRHHGQSEVEATAAGTEKQHIPSDYCGA
jgi:hypothetical protein